MEKRNTKQYNTHVKIGVELSSPELAMMEKLTKQQSIEIHSIPSQNEYPIT